MAKYNEKYFGKNSEVCAVENMLSAGEQIILREKPKRNAYKLAQVFKMMPFALLWIVFDGAFIGLMIGFELFKSMPAPLIVFLVVFFAFHLLPVWIWISNVVTAGRRQKNIEYIFTDRRIIIKSGLIGIDVNNIFYADIQSVNLKVGLVDKLLHVGDIYISGSAQAQVLWDIENPYEVTSRLQKIVNDIKTDIYFPNALRPDTNSGFDTQYKPDK